MSKELIVSTGRHETRVAILEDDQLVELFHEREKEYSLAGSIHKGRVTRVLPGMQSAFVDIGLERDAFLYVSDFFEDNDEYDAVVSTVEEKVLKMEKGGGREIAAPTVRQEAIAPETPLAEAPETVISAPISETRSEPRAERPDRGPDAGQDRGGDRGGRGRRGRRRRGARGGNTGLPESKFFSPRAEAQTVVADESENEVDEAHAEKPAVSAPAISARRIDDDFMVLPGESLAKYAGGDLREEEETLEPEAAVSGDEDEKHQQEQEQEQNFEPAVPAEHPLAGFGDVSSWANTAAPEPAEELVAPAEQAHATAPDSVEPNASASEEIAEPASAKAVAEMSVAESEAEAVEAECEELIAEALEEESAEQAEAAAGISTTEPATKPAPEEEGPEPARIPTSLTATLREQGHRYPHRVSRRMRRKMRGGQPGDGRTPQEQPAEVDGNTIESLDGRPAEAARIVEPRVERRPDQRQERGRGRDRGEREVAPERSDRTERAERPERAERAERPPLPSISDLLKEGQEIIVQIAKEPLGQKGARITSHIALPGRFVVYMPTVDHAGVSRKIPSDDERQRLKRIVQTHRQGMSGGFICRTAAESKSEEELKSDMQFLYNLWLDMRQKAERRPAPVLLHHDLDLVQRILRDQLTTSFKTIWVDSEELYESILRFAERFQPALVGRIKLYTRSNPIFDEFGITGELEKALRPKVWLKSGGYIVINQTEALVAIDINTGKYVGKSNRLEDTIVKINTDAIKEIVRQIRLRDLGGIIVVDFIDMDERRNRQKVMQVLEETMRSDRAPYKILQFNDFGLVAITRKRVKQSLERTLCSPCPYCEGAGYVKSVQTVIGEILQEAQRIQKALATENNIVLRVNPDVAKILKSNQNQFLQEIEEILGKSVLVKSDALLHQTKFDLA